MKKSHYKLIAAWLLLFCFIAGQGIVYSHQHHVLKYTTAHYHNSKSPIAPEISEKCKLCDVMHHTDMALGHNGALAVTLPVVLFNHPQVSFNFTSFGLILSDGLSPPCSINS